MNSLTFISFGVPICRDSHVAPCSFALICAVAKVRGGCESWWHLDLPAVAEPTGKPAFERAIQLVLL